MSGLQSREATPDEAYELGSSAGWTEGWNDARAKIAADLTALMEGEQHFNEACGWDVPAISVRRFIDLIKP